MKLDLQVHWDEGQVSINVITSFPAWAARSGWGGLLLPLWFHAPFSALVLYLILSKCGIKAILVSEPMTAYSPSN